MNTKASLGRARSGGRGSSVCGRRGSSRSPRSLEWALLFAALARSPTAIAISSGSFPNGGYIPKKFTCDGADISPELSWTNPPPARRALR